MQLTFSASWYFFERLLISNLEWKISYKTWYLQTKLKSIFFCLLDGIIMCANEKKSLFQSLFKGMNIVKLQSQVQTSVLGRGVDFVYTLSQQQQEQQQEELD